MNENILPEGILPESLDLKLFQYLKDLQQYYGVTYTLFGIEFLNGKRQVVKKAFCGTDPDWKQTYIDYGMRDHCPILTQAPPVPTNGQSMLIPWDTLLPRDSKEKEVVDARKDHEIFYGASLVRECNFVRTSIGFATDESNKTFMRHLTNDPKKFCETSTRFRNEMFAGIVKFISKKTDPSIEILS